MSRCLKGGVTGKAPSDHDGLDVSYFGASMGAKFFRRNDRGLHNLKML